MIRHYGYICLFCVFLFNIFSLDSFRGNFFFFNIKVMDVAFCAYISYGLPTIRNISVFTLIFLPSFKGTLNP